MVHPRPKISSLLLRDVTWMVMSPQGRSCKRWGGQEEAMPTCRNLCWGVLLVLLEYLLWAVVNGEAVPGIHLIPLRAAKVEPCFVVWLLNKLPKLSHSIMGAF